jgi:hypothetical protein
MTHSEKARQILDELDDCNEMGADLIGVIVDALRSWQKRSKPNAEINEGEGK